ncbi:MAG TPA: helicase-related protein [Novosphingobium sp.]|nr:helicase-related protein [Novosphingobium sp.]
MTGRPSSPRKPGDGTRDGSVRAVLGPTNTGKTHLAIERLCAHSSGAIGFPLRLLAREVYDRVVALKGERHVALITGEERIEPAGARWLLCTAEAMPPRPDLAFLALDEAQLAADSERGHVFTDRLLHARGREETMLLGAATLAPVLRSLVPEAEIVSRPRFSTLSHVGARKLSRIPPRSAIVAFSAEQVYAVAEMLRRFRGGAAVVMGALSPQTRNAQVAMFQSGEVDYIVATDAIGMGLNLDVAHVAFAGLSKFDGHRQRRLTPAEMAQIAGRAGRHQRDGTFGTLAGAAKGKDSRDAEFTPEEVYAIEEHRFTPLTSLYWREPEPRFDSLETLIGDLEAPPDDPALAAAPQAIDLAVLKLLADDPGIVVRGADAVRRFWEACRLPDFRAHGTDPHARFVARLWQDLSAGSGHLGADYVARAIAELDRTDGDIDALQGRIAAIRSWAYVAQRPDWVLARDEMAARARAAEARLSDALHARLTERFVNRRTTVLMRKLGPDAALLPVELSEDAGVYVDGERIGTLEGFRFRVDPRARADDHRLLLAAAERHLPGLLATRAAALLEDPARIALGEGGALAWDGEPMARIERGRALLAPKVRLDPALDALPAATREALAAALSGWLERRVGVELGPLHAIERALADRAAGAELRALALMLVEAGGVIPRGESRLDALAPGQRDAVRRLGVRVGALDVFVPAMLRPTALALWGELARLAGLRPARAAARMPPVLTGLPAALGYRRLGGQQLRVDMAEKLIRAAHEARVAQTSLGRRRRFALDPALARSMGLEPAGLAQLLRLAGFRPLPGRALAAGAYGPPAPLLYEWRPLQPRAVPREAVPAAAPAGAFAALAGWGG